MNATKTIGDRIKLLREKKKITQSELAKELNISRQVISYYETGSRTPNIDDIIFLSDYFCVSTDYLLGLTDSESNDITKKEIVNYTGLTDKSIDFLHILTRSSEYKKKYTFNIEIAEREILLLSFINDFLGYKNIFTLSFSKHLYKYVESAKILDIQLDKILSDMEKYDDHFLSILSGFYKGNINEAFICNYYSEDEKELNNVLKVIDKIKEIEEIRKSIRYEYFETLETFKKIFRSFTNAEDLSDQKFQDFLYKLNSIE